MHYGCSFLGSLLVQRCKVARKLQNFAKFSKIVFKKFLIFFRVRQLIKISPFFVFFFTKIVICPSLIWLSTCISVIMEIDMSRIHTHKIKTLSWLERCPPNQSIHNFNIFGASTSNQGRMLIFFV